MREQDERIRSQQLVALAPFLVLALHEHTRLFHAPAHVEHGRDCVVRLVQQSRVTDGGGEVVCSCGVRRRLGIADGTTERGEDGERVDAERVVGEIVGDRERCAGVLQGSHEPLRETGRPREAAQDDGLQSRPRRRLAQGLLEQHDAPVEALEFGEEQESLGAQRADVAFRQQVGCDRPGARPFPSRALRTSCSQRAMTAIVALVRRRQPDSLLGELRRGGRRAALGRERRGILEHGGGGGVRSVAREREVTGAEYGVVDDPRDPAVNAPSLRRPTRG